MMKVKTMFVSVKFHERDGRAYTYACEVSPSPGDKVTVETKDGVKVVTVFEVDLPEPSFPCKAIIGFAPKVTTTEGWNANGESEQ